MLERFYLPPADEHNVCPERVFQQYLEAAVRVGHQVLDDTNGGDVLVIEAEKPFHGVTHLLMKQECATKVPRQSQRVKQAEPKHRKKEVKYTFASLLVLPLSNKFPSPDVVSFVFLNI